MAVPDRARLVRIELDGDLSAAEGCLLVRGDERPFGLAGDWAGGGALVGLRAAGGRRRGRRSVRVARSPAGGRGRRGRSGERRRRRRLVRLPRLQPRRTARARAASPAAARAAARLRARLLRPRAAARPRRPLVVRGAVDGRARAELRARLELLRARLAEGVRERPVWRRHLPAGAARRRGSHDRDRRVPRAHRRRRDLPGEPVPAAGGGVAGRPARPVRRAAARRSSHATPRSSAGPWGAVCSLSPELFLRRRGREVRERADQGHRAALAARPRARTACALALGQGPRPRT